MSPLPSFPSGRAPSILFSEVIELTESMRDRYGNRIWLVPLLVLLVLLLSFATYEWVIPRTDLEIKTVYHEGIVGGGTGGSINLNVLLTNEGNREIEKLDCRITVRERYGGIVTEKDIEGVSLGKGENTEVMIHFTGSHFSTYVIDLDTSFECRDDTHSDKFVHETHEDVMNIIFVDNLG